MTDVDAPAFWTFDEEASVGTITFNRPSVFNALDVSMAEAFGACVADVVRHPGVRCVVLTGAGKAFMAGGDVGAFAADLQNADRTLESILNHMHPALLALRAMEAPVLAAVNGTAAGAGLSLVLAADYVVAAASTRFVLAYDKLAVTPDCGGSWFLARKVGRAAAFELMLMGKVLSAAEGLDLGIVNAVAADADFAGTVRERAGRIAAGPTRAFGLFKGLLDADLPLAAQLERERESFVAATRTEDFAAAATAFVAKQAARYQGR